jgi:4-aminobutyrate aminotransferase-like enzyme
MKTAVDIVRQYGGIFVCDEVQTGFGRTGTTWGVDSEGVDPDVVTAAKAIANGHPISGVITTAPIADAWKGGNISTFGGNAISCAAALATLDVIVDEGLVGNARAMGLVLREGLDALKAKYAIIGDVRGRGLMQGVELVHDEPAGDRTPNVPATLRFFGETKRRGLLVGRGGLHGNVVRIAPALIATRRDIDDALAIIDDAFAALNDATS